MDGDLDHARRTRAARRSAAPLVTQRDLAGGWRAELSADTFGNWVAKTGAMLQDELDVCPGDPVRLNLPPHWVTAVWVAAVWSVGGVVHLPDSRRAKEVASDAILVLPARGPDVAPGSRALVRVSLHPLGLSERGGGPTQGTAGIDWVDYSDSVRQYPDSFDPSVTRTPATPAVELGQRRLTDADLLALADALGPHRSPAVHAVASDRMTADWIAHAIVLPWIADGAALLITSCMGRTTDDVESVAREERATTLWRGDSTSSMAPPVGRRLP